MVQELPPTCLMFCLQRGLPKLLAISFSHLSIPLRLNYSWINLYLGTVHLHVETYQITDDARHNSAQGPAHVQNRNRSCYNVKLSGLASMLQVPAAQYAELASCSTARITDGLHANTRTNAFVSGRHYKISRCLLSHVIVASEAICCLEVFHMRSEIPYAARSPVCSPFMGGSSGMTTTELDRPQLATSQYNRCLTRAYCS
jgi:hypothetical protein